MRCHLKCTAQGAKCTGLTRGMVLVRSFPDPPGGWNIPPSLLPSNRPIPRNSLPSPRPSSSRSIERYIQEFYPTYRTRSRRLTTKPWRCVRCRPPPFRCHLSRFCKVGASTWFSPAFAATPSSFVETSRACHAPSLRYLHSMRHEATSCIAHRIG